MDESLEAVPEDERLKVNITLPTRWVVRVMSILRCQGKGKCV
jgi:hypothetical protein